ncbi:zinc finger BED domain-containing protein 4-like [Corythoichthys intestinalis]|uniref:zinc finger BED domain-containing protein 4-like n=1 Tax=Corythoichthys intestinalis TaxID=161448 RepID=UPI0025A5E308|nr:zinc finger BED domain-containing protein 4-like [Corythoichthys intestinalis]
MEILEPRYALPSRQHFTNKALPAAQKRLRDHIQEKLKDVPAVGFTTDIWSSSVCPLSLISFTAQWIDPSFNLQRVTLHTQDFRGSHTAERVREAIEGMLNSWGIDKSRVHVIVRDNARNLKKAMDDMEMKSVGCLAHTLQLAVHDGLLSQRSVVDTLATARKIIGHFKHSPLAYSRLEDIQRELKMDVKRLQQDVQVRWNSSLYMLQSILEQKRALLVYSGSYNLPATLTTTQWTLMEKTAEVLVPSEELTKDVSMATASAADVIPAITALRCLLSKDKTTDQGVKTMKSTLLDAVETRFAGIEEEPLYSIATLVDPRYKDRYFTHSDNLCIAKDKLIQEVTKIEERAATVSEESAAAVAGPSSKKKCQEGSSSLGSILDEILEENPLEGRCVSTSAEVQVQTYLMEQPCNRKSNPLQYWKQNASRFPPLADVAAKFLCAPSTSVDSERLFSAVSNILDEKRNRLSADRVEMLIFLKKNLHLILPEYDVESESGDEE